MVAIAKHEVVGTPRRSQSLARHLPTVARILLGLVFTVFGLNGFLSFIPPPRELPPEGALKLLVAFIESGYLIPLVKGTELLAGLLLLSNRFVPLALALLAPVLVNIVAFHAILAPGLTIPIVLVVLEVYLAWSYRSAFAPMLAPRVNPR